MAISKTTEATTLRLKLKTGVDAKGNETFTSKNFTNVAPDLTDEDARSIGTALAGLQVSELAAVYRIDTERIQEQ